MSSWDIPWCLGGDFTIIRFPSDGSTSSRSSWVMREFSSFIDSCNLIDPPLEGARFSWSSHEMKRFLCYLALTNFSSRLSEKIISKEFIKLPFRKSLRTVFPFFFGMRKSLEVDVLLNSRIYGLRWMASMTLSNVFGMNWMLLAPSVLFWKRNGTF